jgi:hypothetical protein
MPEAAWDLLVRRDDLRAHSRGEPPPAELQPGQVAVRVDRLR